VNLPFRLGTRTRYLLVGFTCAVLHNAIVISFDHVGIHYAVASAVSFVVIVLIGYLLHTGLTYEQPRSLGTLARYTAAMAANFPLTVGFLFLLVTIAGLPVFVAAPIGTVLLFGWNFLASRWAIVRDLNRGH
jgi:putative flippase GtrA